MQRLLAHVADTLLAYPGVMAGCKPRTTSKLGCNSTCNRSQCQVQFLQLQLPTPRIALQ